MLPYIRNLGLKLIFNVGFRMNRMSTLTSVSTALSADPFSKRLRTSTQLDVGRGGGGRHRGSDS